MNRISMGTGIARKAQRCTTAPSKEISAMQAVLARLRELHRTASPALNMIAPRSRQRRSCTPPLKTCFRVQVGIRARIRARISTRRWYIGRNQRRSFTGAPFFARQLLCNLTSPSSDHDIDDSSKDQRLDPAEIVVQVTTELPRSPHMFACLRIDNTCSGR